MTDTDGRVYLATVLLIEDDLTLSRLYEEKFTIEAFKILVAHDGETGLKLAQNEDINLILLDVGLPRESGLDVLEKLRATKKGRDIPVIILTNMVSQNDRRKAERLGAIEYLVKAMQTPETVVNKVREHLSSK
ncbi:response regulator [Candidatus Woesebacteria bacterium]|nr:MAG: response regulator [Candidatus Woesebacteria bacterium]